MWLRVDMMFAVQGSEEGADKDTGQMLAVGCGVVCCCQWAVQCHPGQGGCFPELGSQQFGKSVGFSMESPTPEDTVHGSHQERAREGAMVKEPCQAGGWLHHGQGSITSTALPGPCQSLDRLHHVWGSGSLPSLPGTRMR